MKFFENMTTEFKREYTPEINKTIVAFANTMVGKEVEDKAIQKTDTNQFLKSGAMENGIVKPTDIGTPQGGL